MRGDEVRYLDEVWHYGCGLRVWVELEHGGTEFGWCPRRTVDLGLLLNGLLELLLGLLLVLVGLLVLG